MQLSLIHFDTALELQPEFVRLCEGAGARHIDVKGEGAAVRLWGKERSLEALQAALLPQLKTAQQTPQLVFMGSGDFHHMTSFLLAAALEHETQPVTVIHFDNHPDWVKFEGGMHCGSWVNRALAQPLVQKVITLGVCSYDLNRPEWRGANLSLLSGGRLELYPYSHAPSKVRHDYGSNPCFVQQNGALHWQTIAAMGEENFIVHLLSRIDTPRVYITIDKDVLARADAITNWDQGQMRLPYLLALIEAIAAKHQIIGADVTGDYSPPHYSGSLFTKAMKYGEILLDQPKGRVDLAESEKINMIANRLLLEKLSAAMA